MSASLPADRRFSETHQWARLQDDGLIQVGISDHAQEALGDIVFVELPQQGQLLEAGVSFCTIESVKTASDVHAPVSGEIVSVNEALDDAPEALNDDPWGTWLVVVKVEHPEEAMAALMDASTYQSVLDD